MGTSKRKNENKPYLGKPRKFVDHGTLITVEGGKKRYVEGGIKKTTKHVQSARVEQLLDYIASACGTAFSAQERTIFISTNKATGNGERSIRMHLGLSLDTNGTKTIDIPELEIEVKEYPSIRPGASAIKKWGLCKRDMYVLDIQGDLIPGTERFLWTNAKHQLTYSEIVEYELSYKVLIEDFPAEISNYVLDAMKPSRTLDSYPMTAVTWPRGFIIIPSEEYDEAFEFCGISKATPKYRLKRSYLEKIVKQIHQRQTPKMKKIGIVAGAFKPFHVGHLTLIEIAARENDEVRLYISLTDRVRPGEVTIKGETMERIWREHYEKLLPNNVIIEYMPKAKSPIRAAYEFLGKENEAGSDDLYRIYGTNADLDEAFPTESLQKYADGLWTRRQIELQPISRGETVSVSGTEMRNWLHVGDEQSFIENSPAGKAVWDALRADGVELTPLPAPRRRKAR